MAPGILFALAAPALWAICNHVDKYVLSKYFRGASAGAVTLFTSLTAGAIALIIFLFAELPDGLQLTDKIILLVAGATLVISYIPYFYALVSDDASSVVPIYQTIPLFGYIFSYIFLHERLTLTQLLGGMIILTGAVVLSLEFTSEKTTVKFNGLWLMLLSSLLIAVNLFLFRFVSEAESFWTSAYWESIGAFLVGLILLIIMPSYRREFFSVLRNNSRFIIGLSFLSETFNIIAKLLVNFASLLAPLAIVLFLNGFQPLFVFIYGLILTLFFPRIVQEKLSPRIITQKIVSITIILFGTYLLVM